MYACIIINTSYGWNQTFWLSHQSHPQHLLKWYIIISVLQRLSSLSCNKVTVTRSFFKCNNNNSKLNMCVWIERAVNEILYVDRISIFHFNSMAVAADCGGYFSLNFCHNMQLEWWLNVTTSTAIITTTNTIAIILIIYILVPTILNMKERELNTPTL